MKRYILFCMLVAAPVAAGEWRTPDGNTAIIYGGSTPIGPPVCSPPPTGVAPENCHELIVAGGTQENLFDVLDIGPGGRICGPAIVRRFKEGDPALELGPGVCIPSLDGSK